MKKLKRFFIRQRLRWLERQMGDDFDRAVSLKLDKVILELDCEQED